MASITIQFQGLLNQHKNHTLPAVHVNNITAIRFAEHTLNTIHTLLATDDNTLNLDVLGKVNVTQYDQDIHNALIELKNQATQNNQQIVAQIQAHYRTSDKLAKQYVLIRDSRNGHTKKSQERLADIQAQQDAEHAQARNLTDALLASMRAEHYLRVVPHAYATGMVGDWFAVFKLGAEIDTTRPNPTFVTSYVNCFGATEY